MPSRPVGTVVAALAGFALVAAALPAEAGPDRPRRTSSSVAPRSQSGSHHSAGHRSGSQDRTHGRSSPRYRSDHGGHGSYHRPSHYRPSYRSYTHRSSSSCSPYRSYRRYSYRPRYSISFSYGYGGSCDSYGYGHSYSPRYYYGGYPTYSSGVYVSGGSYGVRAPTVIEFDEPSPRARTIDATYASPTDIGFQLLGAGDHDRALAFFADATSRDVSAPMPKLGYALASAAQGSDDRAVWAMRRALQSGAEAIHYWPRNSDLDRLVDSLKARYQARADRYPHTPDRNALFMLATLHYLTDEPGAARAALERAYPGGSGFYDPATAALAAGLDAVDPPTPEPQEAEQATPVPAEPIEGQSEEAGGAAAASDGEEAGGRS